ncbi:hypothetical protein [Cryobacterium sp. TMT3-29-2]|uniref:hypothetical protein n=1 Tax=Cryobacterium sp. TMT3-29-2 TaxID=2555867 RepID=UPI001073A14D|nr:hypothetical protein [Cryobacterium sp. TMT3-29-2]TFC89832.1 hypothetical protein E3O67_06345 [Cryobacterium sp. TMT3-29-2]
MTLGNDPQPLTRRQARELASRNEQFTVESALPSAPAPLEPAPLEPAPLESAQSTDVPSARPSAFAPRVVDVPPRTVQTQDHSTLTRRELRALQAARVDDSGAHQLKHDVHTESVVSPAPATISTVSAPEATSYPFAIDALHVPVAPAKVAPPVEFLVEASPRTKVKSRPGVLHPPVGHWSLARDEVDDHVPGVTQLEPFDQIVARGISAGGIPTTTNALILPSIPHQGSTSGPLSSTGEIMVTGSIDLPRSLGSTGSLPNVFDSSDMDQMLDQLDEGGHHSDVAPVSASRAVSTHASTRGVMAPPKKPGLTVPAVLTVTAGVLAFGVLALIVAGYVLNIF